MPPTPPAPPDLALRFAACAAKMRAAALPEVAIRSFRAHYAQLLSGATGFIPEAAAGPVESLPEARDLAGFAPAGRAALDRAVVIKLNGGLGTSMGLAGPKSLLPVHEGLSFLDIIARQLLALRRASGARLPLLLMNSFSTRAASLAALAAYPELATELPPDFLQHRVPKLRCEDLAPVEWPRDPEKEWCPPGHGDIYPALLAGGMLEQLLAVGYELAFVSNADNLGAVLEPAILGYLAAEGIPFLMEVALRSEADRKGGHLARSPEGRLILRESAQCPPEEQARFQDIERYRFFNTNNLWIHLPTLARILAAGDGLLDLPLIRNRKTVDPADPDSPPVYQLETAMGSAIGLIEGARALCVPRTRFRPVKKTGDLLGLWSDAYRLSPDYVLDLVPERAGRAPLVDLDEAYFGRLSDLEARFPQGAPSLRGCDRLELRGDVRFGRKVVCVGTVRIANAGEAPLAIPDGARLGEPVA